MAAWRRGHQVYGLGLSPRHTISTPLEDLDVAYFDDQDLSEQAERAFESELQRRFQEIPGTFTTRPETSTAVGARLTDDGDVVVIAPFGLRDLFEMILRRNPRRVSRELFLQRLAERRILETWPKVRVVDQ